MTSGGAVKRFGTRTSLAQAARRSLHVADDGLASPTPFIFDGTDRA
jgi:hypothetical protein